MCRASAMPEEGLEPRHADYDWRGGARLASVEARFRLVGSATAGLDLRVWGHGSGHGLGVVSIRDQAARNPMLSPDTFEPRHAPCARMPRDGDRRDEGAVAQAVEAP